MKRRFIFTLAAILTSFAINSPVKAAGTNGEDPSCKDGAVANNKVIYTTERGTGDLNASDRWSAVDSVKQGGSAVKGVVGIDKVSAGLGLGLDYGGIGGNFLVYPQKNIGLFGGVGYPIVGVGFNAGLKVRIIPKNPKAATLLYALAMYGYNAAIQVKKLAELNKLFYGPTFGIGLDVRASRKSKDYWTFALLIPIRKAEVDVYIDNLKNSGVEFTNGLIPIAISIGYRIVLY
jgi:hypothetical protein